MIVKVPLVTVVHEWNPARQIHFRIGKGLFRRRGFAGAWGGGCRGARAPRPVVVVLPARLGKDQTVSRSVSRDRPRALIVVAHHAILVPERDAFTAIGETPGPRTKNTNGAG